MQRTVPQAFSVRQQSLEKQWVTRKLAAASGVPLAFRKRLESCCIFAQVRKCRQRSLPAELRCDVLLRVALRNTQ